jgi:hypothetical protein
VSGWDKIEKLVATFTAGDVVFDEDNPGVFGIVTEVGRRSVCVTWSHGGRSFGPGNVVCLRQRTPPLRVPVPKGAAATRWWNRLQSVRATLRRAGA